MKFEIWIYFNSLNIYIYIITQSVHFSTGFLICRQPVSCSIFLSGIGKASIINIWQLYSCSYGKHQPSTCGFLVLGVFCGLGAFWKASFSLVWMIIRSHYHFIGIFGFTWSNLDFNFCGWFGHFLGLCYSAFMLFLWLGEHICLIGKGRMFCGWTGLLNLCLESSSCWRSYHRYDWMYINFRVTLSQACAQPTPAHYCHAALRRVGPSFRDFPILEMSRQFR